MVLLGTDSRSLDFGSLRRAPDVEAPNLFAWDATDSLILDEAADILAHATADDVAVIGDAYGALTLGALAQLGAPARIDPAGSAQPGLGIRVFQDSIVGELAIRRNAATLATPADAFSHVALGAALVQDARVVLMQLPRGLGELGELAALIAAFAASDVIVVAGGRIKHMSVSMNDVLSKHFERVDVRHARQKSRVLVARGPIRAPIPPIAREYHADLDLWVCGSGAVFAGTTIDIGTRALIEATGLGQGLTGGDASRIPSPKATTAVDLGCGSGVISALLARQRPQVAILATDASAGAVASTLATIEANSLANVTVTRDDALSRHPDDSTDLVLLNPPFHSGGAVHTGVASKLFAAAERVLRRGGELWTVYNSSLAYRGELNRMVGPTREVLRNSKFTVTVSNSRKN